MLAADPLASVIQDQPSALTTEHASNPRSTDPGPNPRKHTQLDTHPGWARSGRDNTPGRKAYYINLEAKPGKGDQVERFLRDILAGVEQEPSTGPWFGCRFSGTTFGIFEAFPDTAARNAYDIGPGDLWWFQSTRPCGARRLYYNAFESIILDPTPRGPALWRLSEEVRSTGCRE